MSGLAGACQLVAIPSSSSKVVDSKLRGELRPSFQKVLTEIGTRTELPRKSLLNLWRKLIENMVVACFGHALQSVCTCEKKPTRNGLHTLFP